MSTPAMIKSFSLNRDDQQRLVEMLDGRIAAMHNHIASAVENPDHWNEAGHSAQNLVRELRQFEELRARMRALFPQE